MTLLEKIRNGENVALEFNEASPKDSLKFTKAVVAFANGRGGRIMFGVEDKTGRHYDR
jgi:predicted HTH transcriptional regulator